MRQCYLTLRDLSLIVGMSPVSLTYMMNGTGESISPKNKTNKFEISLEHNRSNRKLVELNSFMIEHKASKWYLNKDVKREIHNNFSIPIKNSYTYDDGETTLLLLENGDLHLIRKALEDNSTLNLKDIDYTDYLFEELEKDKYIEHYGEYVSTATLKNVFKLTANQVKKLKDEFKIEQVETGINGLRGKQYRYSLKEIHSYLPEKIYIRNLKCLCYTLSEVHALMNENGICIERLTLYRNIEKLPAIRLRKDFRIIKPLIDEMIKNKMLHELFKKHIGAKV